MANGGSGFPQNHLAWFGLWLQLTFSGKIHQAHLHVADGLKLHEILNINLIRSGITGKFQIEALMY